eukprot:6004-Heterococcus_DN1.PRE.1
MLYYAATSAARAADNISCMRAYLWRYVYATYAHADTHGDHSAGATTVQHEFAGRQANLYARCG